MTAILYFASADPEQWRLSLSAKISDLDFRTVETLGRLSDIEYVMMWGAPAGALPELPNLKAVMALGAGVDKLLERHDLPDGVPIVRLADDGLIEYMNEYVVMNVLRHHRDAPGYARQQGEKIWRARPWRPARQRRVGFLGLGSLGVSAARAVAAIGFDVWGWSRTAKAIDQVRTFSSVDQLASVTQESDILVCLLPITPDTNGLLNAEIFDKMPDSASLINAGRGAVIVEKDLLDALDNGKLDHASLDVFAEEPLPPDHPFWLHPRVTLTPHVASPTDPTRAATYIAEVIAADRAGRALPNLVQRSQGY